MNILKGDIEMNDYSKTLDNEEWSVHYNSDGKLITHNDW